MENTLTSLLLIVVIAVALMFIIDNVSLSTSGKQWTRNLVVIVAVILALGQVGAIDGLRIT